MTDAQKSPGGISNIISTVFCWGIVIGGCVLMILGVLAAATAWSSAGWPTTKAIVVESKIEDRSGEDVTWGSIIIYKYHVNDRQFTGDRVYPGDSKSASHRLGIIRNAPVGSTKTVHYRPSDPATAYLEAGVQPHTFMGFVMGSLLATFGGVFIVVSRLARKSGVPYTSEGYSFPLDHPVSKVCLASFVLIAVQFALFFYCAK